MKIVDEKPFEFGFECQTCKSQLIAESGDVKVGYFGANYGGDSPERKYYVACPVCGANRILNRSDVPPKVQARADRTDPRGGYDSSSYPK